MEVGKERRNLKQGKIESIFANVTVITQNLMSQIQSSKSRLSDRIGKLKVVICRLQEATLKQRYCTLKGEKGYAGQRPTNQTNPNKMVFRGKAFLEAKMLTTKPKRNNFPRSYCNAKIVLT